MASSNQQRLLITVIITFTVMANLVVIKQYPRSSAVSNPGNTLILHSLSENKELVAMEPSEKPSGEIETSNGEATMVEFIDFFEYVNKESKDFENDVIDETNKTKYIRYVLKNNTDNAKDSKDNWPSRYYGPGVCRRDQYGKRVTHKNRFCRRLPDAAIVGFEKCGTMTLLTFLGVHPDIIETSFTKNLDFFSTSSNLTYCILSKSTACTPPGIIKVSKLAVLDMNPAKVYKFKKDMRLIFIVRDPVERALSHFVHIHAGTSLDTPVKEFTNRVSALLQDMTNTSYMRTSMLGLSFYILKLREWLKYFPMKNIHIVDGDKFIENPVEELQRIERFLKLRKYIKPSDFVYDKSKQFYCMRKKGDTQCMPDRKGREHPRMMQHTKETLKKLFLPYNQEFYKLVGRTFPWD